MAFTAELIRAIKENGKWSLTIRFSDGNERIDKSYTRLRASPLSLKRLAIREIAELDGAKGDSTPPLSDIDLTPEVPTPSTPPTQAEIDRASWFDDYNTLKQLIELTTNVPDMVTPTRTTRIANLRVSLKADFKPAYLGGI